MKRSINLFKGLSILLSLALLISILPMAVFAADLPFTDVSTSDWFYDDVKTAYDGSLINGKSETTFEPYANLTYAEAVKLAACMHQKSTIGSVMLKNGTPWYQSYVDYCKLNGIISKDYAWNEPATRAGYMEIFAKALPDSALPAINTIPDGAIPDVPMTHPQAASIYKLYRAGILQGVDSAHNCNPDSNIKRCEVAAILTRMMNASKRLSFTMGETTTPLTITGQPLDTSVDYGLTATMLVTVVGGTAPYSYQWETSKDGGETWSEYPCVDSTLYLSYCNLSALFRCVITDGSGAEVTSDAAALNVGLAIYTQPQSVTAVSGTTATFSVAPDGGVKPYQYQWQMAASIVPGNTVWVNVSSGVTNTVGQSTLTTSVGTTSTSYRCIITDAAGNTVTSDTAKLTVVDPLTITTQPQDVTVSYEAPATFSVVVTGGLAPYTYQWQCDKHTNGATWTDMAVASSSVLSLPICTTSPQYRCIITDALGNQVVSEPAQLTIGLTILAQPKNITVPAGCEMTIYVNVVGDTGPYTYQWQMEVSSGTGKKTFWINVPSGTSSILTTTVGTTSTRYRCIITDAAGNQVTSDAAVITVQ